MSICTYEDCTAPIKSLGLCLRHYTRQRKYGSPDVILTGPTQRERRFWGKVEKTDSCWVWKGGTHKNGGLAYGWFAIRESKSGGISAHRYSYTVLVGEIPSGLQLDHLCRNPLCVNPEHLEPVTGRVNILRGTSPVAKNAAATHCKYGHPFSGDNLRITPRGWRKCRTCDRVKWKEENKRRWAREKERRMSES